MPLIKEVVFNKETKFINFMSQEEMINKIELLNDLEFKEKSNEKYHEKIYEKLEWFQKFKVGEKEFFIEKVDNPLRLKKDYIEIKKRETGIEHFLIALLGSLFPFGILPYFLSEKMKNYMNGKKNKNKLPVIIQDDNIGLYVISCILGNIISIISLVNFGSWTLFFGIIISNLLMAYMKHDRTYIEISNYEIDEFTLVDDDMSNSDISVDLKINKMEAKEIIIKNEKIKHDFLKELEEEQTNEQLITSNNKNFKNLL